LVSLGILALSLVALLWGYWNTLSETAKYWEGDQYSHGVLVPLFAVALLWLRRKGGTDDAWAENPAETRVLGVSVGLMVLCLAMGWFAGWLYPAVKGAEGATAPAAEPWLKQFLGQSLPSLLYVAGILVLGLSTVLFWTTGRPAGQVPVVQRCWGLALLAAGLSGRLMCADIGLDVPEMWTFLPSLAGLVLLVGGWPLFRWSLPAVGFLFFMFPLPFTVESKLLVPLQEIAARCSTFALQTLGVEATNQGGNYIQIGQLQLGVVEQCSGLRMATVFVALSVAIVLVARLPWWQNLVVLASAVPIALLVNVTRITVTGVLHVTAGKEWADRVFHDWAGYMMPILALLLLWGELAIMSRLFYEVEVEDQRASLIPTRGHYRR